MSKPRWWEVFASDAERRFFVGRDNNSGLVRKAGFRWRTLEFLAKEGGLTLADAESIAQKYIRMGIVIQNEARDKIAYWELVCPASGDSALDVVRQDQEERLQRASQKK